MERGCTYEVVFKVQDRWEGTLKAYIFIKYLKVFFIYRKKFILVIQKSIKKKIVCMALKVLHFLKPPWKRQIFGSEILVEKLHAYSSE